MKKETIGKPIIFSAPMMRALLDGRKTQARRVMKVQPPTAEQFPHSGGFGLEQSVADGIKVYSLNNYDRLPKNPDTFDLVGSVGVARDAGFPMKYKSRFAVGDLLWVRETWRGWVPVNAPWQTKDLGVARYTPDPKLCQRVDYKATHEPDKDPYRPSTQMPRWASRLTLRVTNIRAERLQDISEEDARAEGANFHDGDPDEYGMCRRLCVEAKDDFRHIWEDLYHKDSPKAWHRNPWVWVYEFDVIRKNVGEVS